MFQTTRLSISRLCCRLIYLLNYIHSFIVPFLLSSTIRSTATKALNFKENGRVVSPHFENKNEHPTTAYHPAALPYSSTNWIQLWYKIWLYIYFLMALSSVDKIDKCLPLIIPKNWSQQKAMANLHKFCWNETRNRGNVENCAENWPHPHIIYNAMFCATGKLYFYISQFTSESESSGFHASISITNENCWTYWWFIVISLSSDALHCFRCMFVQKAISFIHLRVDFVVSPSLWSMAIIPWCHTLSFLGFCVGLGPSLSL